VAAACALVLAACDSGALLEPEPSFARNGSEAVHSVIVSPSSAYLAVNGTLQLTATAQTAGGAPATVRKWGWASSNTAVATVTSRGLVTARAAGEATVTVSADGVTARATIRVGVAEPGAVPSSSPFSGARFYVDPNSNARKQADAWYATRPADAQEMEKIARGSQADWFGDWNGDIRAAVDERTSRIAAAGALPLFVAYNIPQRDCGSYSAGGAGSAEAYRAWIDAFAAGIGARRAVVILEPDGLAGLDCLNATDRARRIELLRYAVGVLKALPAVAVYLDAGHARWHSVETMAERLGDAGIAVADGFALNVSNFHTTSENADYGSRLSARVGNRRFVIDTSRNGAGSNGEWCNPAGRALGPGTSAETGHPLVDAFLWIKRPGESDGTCNGGPRAGAWWADYALGLAVRAPTLLAGG
jgi:endoglucanase